MSAISNLTSPHSDSFNGQHGTTSELSSEEAKKSHSGAQSSDSISAESTQRNQSCTASTLISAAQAESQTDEQKLEKLRQHLTEAQLHRGASPAPKRAATDIPVKKRERTPEVDRAIAIFRSNDYLSNNEVEEYAKYLQKSTPFIFAAGLLYSISDGSWCECSKQYFSRTILTAVRNSKNKQLIFIPFVLRSHYKNITLIGQYIPNHIVILTIDPVKRVCEYYDPQGGNIQDETRKISVLDEPANVVFKDLIELLRYHQDEGPDEGFTLVNPIRNNPVVHQRDYHSCGVLISRFMRERLTQSFETICKTLKIDIASERKRMADELESQFTEKV